MAKKTQTKKTVNSSANKNTIALAKTEAKQASKAAVKAVRSVKDVMSIVDILIDNAEADRDTLIQTIKVNANLTPAERRRLIGTGIKNYGFLDKAYDVLKHNRAFEPPNFDFAQMGKDIHELEILRNLVIAIEKYLRTAEDIMLIRGNGLYREALRIYNTLREQSRSGVEGARDVFLALEPFFKRRRPAAAEPTMKQLNKDIRAVEKGRADGKIVIENIKPKLTGGVHKVVDEVSRGRKIVKESGEFEES